MNRAEIVTGLATIRHDKTTDDDTYDLAGDLTETIGHFPDGRDDYPELLPLLAQAEDMLTQYRQHSAPTEPVLETMMVKDRATGEIVPTYVKKTTRKDRGRTIIEAADTNGAMHRVEVLDREETKEREELAQRPIRIEQAHQRLDLLNRRIAKARSIGLQDEAMLKEQQQVVNEIADMTEDETLRFDPEVRALLEALRDTGRPERFNGAVKTLMEWSYAMNGQEKHNMHAIWPFIDPEVKGYLKASIPALSLEKGLAK
jgi:hypothetical protein